VKKTWLSVFASFLFPGVGHFYLGETKKGFLLLISYIVSLLLTIVVIGFIPMVIIWIYSMVDSYKLTSVINDKYRSNLT
jgi:TM2 domain-containing membrane protein YozV